MILPALLLAAHWVAWSPNVVQMGVSVGTQSDEHLILMVTRDGCSAGMKMYSGQYGDLEKSLKFMEHSDVCKQVEDRAAAKSAQMKKE